MWIFGGIGNFLGFDGNFEAEHRSKEVVEELRDTLLAMASNLI